MKKTTTTLLCLALLSLLCKCTDKERNSSNTISVVPLVPEVSGGFEEFLEIVPKKKLPYHITFSDLNFKPEGYVDIDQKYLTFGMIPLLKKREQSIQEKEKAKIRYGLIQKYLGPSFMIRIPPVIEPIQYFETDEGFFVVIFSSYSWNNWSGRIECKIFDRQGEEINHLEIASSQQDKFTTIASISPKLIIKKERYENEWEIDLKKSYEDGTFENNRIINRKLKTTEFYQINQFGEFEFLKKVENKV